MANETAKAKGSVDSATTICLKHLPMLLDMAYQTKDSVMLWGPGGIGKSESVASYANSRFPLAGSAATKARLEELEVRMQVGMSTQREIDELNGSLLDQDTNLIDFRLASIDPTDIRGVPIHVPFWQDDVTGRIYHSEDEIAAAVKENPDKVRASNIIRKDGMVWVPPAIMQLPRTWKGVIFCDEMNQAIPVVQAAAYSLFLDRKIGEITIPDGALVLAAGNRAQDGGATFNLATPLRDRMTHYEVEVTPEEWIENFAIPHMIDPTVVAFVKNNGTMFHTLNPKDPSHCGGSSPRSWVRVSDMRQWQDGRLFKYGTPAERDGNQAKAALYRSALAAVSGRVGGTVAAQYLNYCDNLMDLPDIDSVLNAPLRNNTIAFEYRPDKMNGATLYGYMLMLAMRLGVYFRQVRDKKRSEESMVLPVTNFMLFLHEIVATKAGRTEFLVVGFRTALTAQCQFDRTKYPIVSQVLDKYKAEFNIR